MIAVVLAGLIQAAEVECVGGFTTLADRTATVVESQNGDLRLLVRDVAPDEWWTVTVSMEGATRADRARVWVRRSKQQSGLTGPRLYARVLEEPLVVVQGRGPVDAVPLQLRLTGMEIEQLALWVSRLEWSIGSQRPAWAPTIPESKAGPSPATTAAARPGQAPQLD